MTNDQSPGAEHPAGPERELRRTAVIVFLECEGYDDRDAESGAVLAVRQTLTDRRMLTPAEVTGMGAGGEFKAVVHDVIGLSWAGSQYVRISPTGQAFR